MAAIQRSLPFSATIQTKFSSFPAKSQRTGSTLFNAAFRPLELKLVLGQEGSSPTVGAELKSNERCETTLNSADTDDPIIVIDNYDSFTYNICQYIGELGYDFEVYRNDELTIEELKRKNPSGLLISPGPGTPQESGISTQAILEVGPTVPILGVCMGLQCIGEAFGGKIVRSPGGVMHGKSSLVHYLEEEDSIFSGLLNPFVAARYHSLVIERESFPAEQLMITAWTEDALIMAARHKMYKHIQGVQFHPESILTLQGKAILGNFLRSLKANVALPQK